METSRFRRAVAFLSIAALAVFTMSPMIVPRAQAHQSPNGCTNNDFVLNLGKNKSLVYDETSPFGPSVITYSVTTGNPNTSGSGCDVTGVTVTLTTPDGVVHTLQTGGSYPIGTAPAVLGTVNYTANSSDKTGSNLVATANATGTLHDIPTNDPLNITKQVSVLVINPSTITSINSSATQVTASSTVDLTVTEQNNGDVALTSPSVVVTTTNPTTTVATLVAPPNSGDNGNGVLDPGETWTWVIHNVVVHADSTFVATGHGLDPLENDVTYPADQDERDVVEVNVVNPTTITSITASSTQVLAGGTTNLTVTEQNDGDVPLTNPSVVVTNGTSTVATLVAPPNSGDNGNGILDPGETWTWVINGVVVNSNTTFVATGHGTDPFEHDITYPGDQDERDSVEVTVLHPSTVTTITATSTLVIAGSTVNLNVTESNDGDVPLTSPSVVVTNGTSTVATLVAPPTSGDNGNGILDPGETWTWVVPVVVNADTTFTATGHGLDPFENDITFPADQDEQASVRIGVTQPGCTLTQGYWKTHSIYGPAAHPDANWASVGGPDASFYLSGLTWLQVFNTAPKGNVYFNLADQYMAAVLNVNSGASAPTNVQNAITTANTLLSTYTPAQIGALKASSPIRQQFISLAGILGNYNEGIIGPGHCGDETTR